jgi:hypothetical protein
MSDCNKIRFATQAEARERMMAASRKGKKREHGRLATYHCDICNAWHFGHNTPHPAYRRSWREKPEPKP